MWNRFVSHPEEDSTEGSETVAQDAPTITENEQPVADLIAPVKAEGSSVAEVSDISSNVESCKTSDHDSCPEKDESSLPNDSQIAPGNEEFDLISFESDVSTLPTECITDESPKSNGGIRRRLEPLMNEERRNSSGHDEVKLEADETIFNRKLLLFDLTTFGIGLLVPILAICFGIGNVGKCPANFFMPYLTLFMGVLGLFIVSYALLKTRRDHFDCLTENERNVIQVFSNFFIVLLILQVYQLFNMDVSFDVSAENYCNLVLYVFIIIMDIVSALGVVIGFFLMVYISDGRDSSTLNEYMEDVGLLIPNVY